MDGREAVRCIDIKKINVSFADGQTAASSNREMKDK